jgi:hypothetical protein
VNDSRQCETDALFLEVDQLNVRRYIVKKDGIAKVNYR